MFINVNFSMFCDAFARVGRQDQFSYHAKQMIFDHFEEMENDTGEQFELDIVAICCDFSENSIADIVEYYQLDIDDDATDDELKEAVQKFLDDITIVLGWSDDDVVVFQQF